MAFRNSRAARDRRQLEELALKRSLENALAGRLRGFFRRISSDFRVAYSATGLIINVRDYEDELVDILRPHYRAVSRRFGRRLRREIRTAFHLDMEYKQDDPEVDGEIRNFVNVTPVIQAGFIISSTENIISDIVTATIAEQLITGQAMTNAQIASAAGIEIARRNQSRADTIAQTETQKAAEASKFIEADMLIQTGSEVNGFTVSDMTVKEWNAVLDTNTRDFHATADGQRRPVNEPYLVNDELLNYPGDTSLGASLNNVINCRCGSQFVIDANTISAEQVDLRPRDFSQAGSPLIVRYMQLHNIPMCEHFHTDY